MVMNEFTKLELKSLAKQMRVTPSEAIGCAVNALLTSNSADKLASVTKYRKNKKEYNLALDKAVAIPSRSTDND